MLPLAEEEAARLLAAVPADKRAECWWIVRPDRMPVAGKAGGGVVLLSEIRLTRRLGRALAASGISPLLDACDAVFARHRVRLSRLVPDGPAPRRYP
ncbi:MAG: hypothetical protein WD690_10685 [Vicinamibacterales bacterium]